MPSALQTTPSDSGTTRDRARRACTALLTGIVVFVGLQLVVACAFDVGPLRDPLYGGRLGRLLQQVRAAPEKPLTIVLLGTSRTLEGVRANSLHDPLSRALGRPVAVANFGLNGCGPTTHLLTWNRLRCDGVRPDVAVIEVLPAMLSETWRNGEVSEEQLRLCRVRRCDLPVIESCLGDVRPGLRRDWWLAWPNTLYNYRLSLVSRLAPALLPFEHRVEQASLPEDEPAAAPDFSAERRHKALEFARAGYAETLQTFRLGGRGCASLRELLTCVRRDGVRPVLLVMPEGPEFRSWYAPGAYDQVRNWLAAIATEFGAELFETRDWMAEADFIDSHHLTRPASAVFTKRLADECLIPLLRGRSESPTSQGPRASAR